MGHPGRGPKDFLCVQDEWQLRTFPWFCGHPDQQASQRKKKTTTKQILKLLCCATVWRVKVCLELSVVLLGFEIING